MPRGVYVRTKPALCGVQHQSWKGTESRSLNNGYWILWLGGKRVYEHRLIMERHLGRPLARQEFVHHVNGDRLDNDIGNLQVMTIGEHNRLHKKGIAWGHALNCQRQGGDAL